MRYALVLAVVATGSRVAAADGRLIDDETFAVPAHGSLALDAGLVVGAPAALPSGLATGLGAGVTRTCGCLFAYGARLAWTTVTESSETWTVSHQDFRLRVFGALHHDVGRGSLALRLGVGPTIVHENRTRNQAMREGRTDLDTSATAALPALDLEAMFALHVTGPWLAIVNAGPTIDRFDGAIRTGWTAGLGLAWQP